MKEELAFVKLGKGVLVCEVIDKGIHEVLVSLMLSGRCKGRAMENKGRW